MMKLNEQRPDRNPDCTMGVWPDKSLLCNPWECATCGFNPRVEKRRKEQLRKEYGE